MNPLKYLELAAKVSRLKDDARTYYHGAVGIRRDGVLVAASNGNPHKPEPRHHCEYRLLRKLGRGGTVFLVRTLHNGDWADTTPCIHCQNAIRSKGVKCVYFTDGPESWLKWSVGSPLPAHVALASPGPSVSPVPRDIPFDYPQCVMRTGLRL